MDLRNEDMTQADQLTTEPPQVSVIIPTYNRNDLLATCLRSCVSQRSSFDQPFEIVVVDNSVEAAATPVVDKIAAETDLPIRLVHQPEPGISNARNAGIAAAKAPFIAWIDDDEFASETWLRDLWTTAHDRNADIVFGSVEPRFAGEVAQKSPEIVKFFSKNSSNQQESEDKHFSTSNCMMKREICDGLNSPFSLARNFTGGEDHLFFIEARNRNVKFAWDRNSIVYETIPNERANWNYLLSRSYRKHQIMVQNFFDVRPRDWGMVARCMILGAGQFIVYGVVGGALWLVRSRRAEPIINRSMIGLGKLIWFRPFQAEPYGRSR